MLHWNNNSGQKSRSTSLIALLVFGLIFGFAINYFSHQQANAIVSVCGNEALELFEECDDGNTVNGDGCSSFCLTEIDTIPTSVCGNGVVQSEEECDDGNSTDGDGCSTECTLEPGFVCTSGSLWGDCESGGTGSVVSLKANIHDPATCSGMIYGSGTLFSGTSFLVTLSGTSNSNLYSFVPITDLSGNYYIPLEFTSTGSIHYIISGTYHIHFAIIDTQSVEITGASYTQYLGYTCMSGVGNGGGYTPVPLPTPPDNVDTTPTPNPTPPPTLRGNIVGGINIPHTPTVTIIQNNSTNTVETPTTNITQLPDTGADESLLQSMRSFLIHILYNLVSGR